MRISVRINAALTALVLASSLNHVQGNNCPKLYKKGMIHLDIRPAYLHIDDYKCPGDTEPTDGLTINSFFNVNFVQYGNKYVPSFPPFAPDQVGRICNMSNVDPHNFQATNFEKLTGNKTVWPNDSQRIPDGVLPFEGLIVPQGFLSAGVPGRLSIIRLDTPDRTEYIVHQSTRNSSLPPESPGNKPRFYHRVLFHDMDDDGLLDIVTVRGSFGVGASSYPPNFAELVYFSNPGESIDPVTPWQEVVLYGGPLVGYNGPDIDLEMYDFEGDGVPEIVATHFYTGGGTIFPPINGKIALYGAPVNQTWASVNANSIDTLPRVATISDNQGFPFEIDIIDLNADGKVDILATNHQSTDCSQNPTIPGRVYALQQPASGDIFNDIWPVRVLVDHLLPQPDMYGVSRSAPGHVVQFYLNGKRPWILVSGDQAGKVWLMKPKGRGWSYETNVIFDINDYYGPLTTQTVVNPGGYIISTIGQPAIRYKDRGGNHQLRGRGNENVEIYIPVFEAKDIHVMTFEKGAKVDRLVCPDDVTLNCTIASMMFTQTKVFS